MVIEFAIPNGSMRIDPDVFFREAERGRIRRMFRLMGRSGPGPELVREIREWLTGGIQAEAEMARSSAFRRTRHRMRLRELEEHYRRMRSPCCAAYTADKGQLAAAKEDISRCRAAVMAAERAMEQARGRAEKYNGVLEDAEKILA